MNIDFYTKNGFNNIVHTSQVSSKTHSHTFYKILGKIVFADFEKIGEFPKNFPRRISRERNKATTTKLR